MDDPRFADDVATRVAKAGHRLAHLMVPKVGGRADVRRAREHIDRRHGPDARTRPIPVHLLIETHGRLREVVSIAAHPRVESVSFGLMDFVAAHGGAIPGSALSASGQFAHPLVRRAELAIAAACHGWGKNPSHCVVTEFNDPAAVRACARRAAREPGCTRMWSIHPNQIVPIVEAFAPAPDEIETAVEIPNAAQDAHWAPTRHRAHGRDTLQDRASRRRHWPWLERARRTGRALPADVVARYFKAT